MLFERRAEDLTELIIVFQRLDLRHSTKSLECFIIQLINKREVRV